MLRTSDYASFPSAESVLGDGNDEHQATDVVFVYFKETRPARPHFARTNHEKIAVALLNRFFLSRVVITTSAFR